MTKGKHLEKNNEEENYDVPYSSQRFSNKIESSNGRACKAKEKPADDATRGRPNTTAGVKNFCAGFGTNLSLLIGRPTYE